MKDSEAQLAEIQELLRADQNRAKLAAEREAETARIEASIVTAERERFIDATQRRRIHVGQMSSADRSSKARPGLLGCWK